MSRSKEPDKNLTSILNKLGLTEYFPEKIDLQDVMTIEAHKDEPVTNTSLAWKILRGIIMSNCGSREIVVDYSQISRCTDNEVVESESGNDCSTISEDSENEGAEGLSSDDSFDDLFDGTDEIDGETIHPSDVLLAVFHCCNFKLRQIVFQKLYTCKIAWPLFIGDPFGNSLLVNLWPLRGILIDFWDNGQMREDSYIDVPSHVVSFIRIGKHDESKSKIINGLLSNTAHPTFYNRHCANAAAKRCIEGYVDGSLFIPSNQKEDLPKVTLFLNLRGDAIDNEKRVWFMANISSTVVVFVDIKDLNSEKASKVFSFLKTRTILPIMFNESKIEKNQGKEILTDFKREKGVDISNRMSAMNVNETEIVKSLKKKLKECLGKMTPKPLTSVVMENAGTIGVTLDEDSDVCKKARDQAMNAIGALGTKYSQEGRTNVLPLHGSCWEHYSKLLKDERRLFNDSTKDALENKDRVHQKIIDKRKEQFDQFPESYKAMKTFIDYLKEIYKSKTELDLFLGWMQLRLDEQSRKILHGLHKECDEAHRLLRSNTEDEKTTKEELTTLVKEVENCEKKLNNNTIGLEHMFRELSQIYECIREHSHEVQDTKETYSLLEVLPCIMANIIANGYPFEIMDGDVSNIPTKWLKAVFESLVKLLGDKRVFVVSILGIQSAGKSTLLNTMFGMQFAVSAGRCTKGIFAQLLPVGKECQRKLEYDFVFVVDTEGLRAPELNLLGLEHDNELATLALGLADVTIINIKGETQTEMRDTLQIAIHAFLRMKMADNKLKAIQRCIFVHNNFPICASNDKILQAKRGLEVTLNTMIVETAKAVKCGDVRSYEEVLKFNAKKDVWHLSNLWKGDPPMAPVNISYAEQVARVKTYLIEVVEPSINVGSILTLSNLRLRIDDLWNAILSEDFIFSFRNSLEAIAYRSIVDKFIEIKRTLKATIMQWVNETVQGSFTNCSTTESLTACHDSTLDSLDEIMPKKKAIAKEQLEKVFDTGDLKAITIQWKTNKLSELNFCSEEISNTAKRRIENMTKERKNALINADKKTEIEDLILKECIRLADDLRSAKKSNEELAKAFDLKWQYWSAKFPRIETQDVDISEKIMISLTNNLQTERNLLQQEIGRQNIDYYNGLPLPLILDWHDLSHIGETYGIDVTAKFDPKVGHYRKLDDDSSKTDAQNLSLEIFKKLQKRIRDLTEPVRLFQEEDIDVILDIAQEAIFRHTDSSDAKYFILPPLEVKILVHVCRLAFPYFSRQQIRYQQQDCASSIESFRQTYFNLFMNCLKERTAEVQTSDMFCDKMKEAVKARVDSLMPNELISCMQKELINKRYLLAETLRYLLTKNKFSAYQEYIKSPRSSVEKWVKIHIQTKWCTGAGKNDSRYTTTWKTQMTKLLNHVRKVVKETSSCLQNNKKITKWMQKFCEEVSSKVPVPPETMRNICRKTISNTDNFLDCIQKGLDRIEDELRGEKLDSGHLWKAGAPHTELVDGVWGCMENCPFCAEPCADSTALHNAKHSCVQHKPQGINAYRAKSSKKLTVENCCYLVQSNKTFSCSDKCKQWKCSGKKPVGHKYKKYAKYFQNWCIQPSATIDSSPYWNWFMCTFSSDLTRYHGTEYPQIPKSWKSITEATALESLRLSSV